MNVVIKELVTLCKLVGARVPLWTQGRGGNISVKSKGRLYIKATGRRLDSVNIARDISCIDQSRFLNQMGKIGRCSSGVKEAFYAEALTVSRLDEQRFGKPSMETGFHANLPKKYVLHFHSLVAILAAEIFDEATLNRQFSRHVSKGFRLKVVDYVKPGLDLSLVIAADPTYDVYLLKNHGVVLQCVNRKLLRLWDRFEIYLIERAGFQIVATIRRQKQKGFLGAVKIVKAAGPLPSRVYFPDTAVFLNELIASLQKIGKRYVLPAKPVREFLDLHELWVATQILFLQRPELPELPKSMVRTLGSLPTEKIRKQEMTRSKGSVNH